MLMAASGRKQKSFCAAQKPASGQVQPSLDLVTTYSGCALLERINVLYVSLVKHPEPTKVTPNDTFGGMDVNVGQSEDVRLFPPSI